MRTTLARTRDVGAAAARLKMCPVAYDAQASHMSILRILEHLRRKTCPGNRYADLRSSSLPKVLTILRWAPKQRGRLFGKLTLRCSPPSKVLMAFEHLRAFAGKKTPHKVEWIFYRPRGRALLPCLHDTNRREVSMSKHAHTLEQAAEALGVSRRTVYVEIGAGRLQSFTIGRRRLISDEALRRYVEARERESARHV